MDGWWTPEMVEAFAEGVMDGDDAAVCRFCGFRPLNPQEAWEHHATDEGRAECGENR